MKPFNFCVVQENIRSITKESATPSHNFAAIIFQAICQICADHEEIPFFRATFLLVDEILTLCTFPLVHFTLSLSPLLTLNMWRTSHIARQQSPAFDMQCRKYENLLCTKSTNHPHDCRHRFVNKPKRDSKCQCQSNKVFICIQK